MALPFPVADMTPPVTSLARTSAATSLLLPLARTVAACSEELLATSGPRLRVEVEGRLGDIGAVLGASRVIAWRVDRRRRQVVVDYEWAASGQPPLVEVRPFSEWSDLPWAIDGFGLRPARVDSGGPVARWLAAEAVLLVPAIVEGRLLELIAVTWVGAANGGVYTGDGWTPGFGVEEVAEPPLRQLGLAMSAARDRRELTERASYDELTGLANRPFLVLALGKMLARVSRGKSAGVAVLFCQLAGLDPTDRSAFERADNAVARAAVMLERSTRETDFVGRWDDTTFTALCDEVPTVTEALRIGRRLQQSVLKEIRVDFSDDPGWPGGNIASMRVVVGVAFTDTAANAGVLLRQADLALYQARLDIDDPVKLVLE